MNKFGFGQVYFQLTCPDGLVIFTARKVCEGYVFTGVCLSTEGACVVGGSVRGRGDAWGRVWLGGMCGRGANAWQGVCVVGGHAWQGVRATHALRQILWHTVNERVVRTLLECILVRKYRF